MVQLTRLDCAIASAGLMRMALAQAVHHCRHRNVFAKRLYDQPMMRAVLADMALDVEAAVAFVFRLARALDRAADDPREAAYARVMTPAAKYWICKLAPGFIFEAMECLGGNGYVEESILPRLYREAPVNAIWEGSGNVMCLDVLRALKREEEAELVAALARDAGIDAATMESTSEADARAKVGQAGFAGVRGGTASERARGGGGSIHPNAAGDDARRALRRGADRCRDNRIAAAARIAGSVRTLTSGIWRASRSSAP